jgi:hypothetical protein
MPEEHTESGSLEVGAGDKRISIRGIRVADWIGIFITICLTLVGFMLWDHKEDSKVAQAAFLSTIKEVSTANTIALKELTVSQKEGTAAQKEQNCLLRFVQADRQANADFCKQMGRAQ